MPTPADPCNALRLARAAAVHELRLDRDSLERLNQHMAPLTEEWPDEARGLFVDVLLAGPEAPPVIEALDQMDLFVRILPEWAPQPQPSSAQRLPPVHRGPAPVRGRGPGC